MQVFADNVDEGIKSLRGASPRLEMVSRVNRGVEIENFLPVLTSRMDEILSKSTPFLGCQLHRFTSDVDVGDPNHVVDNLDDLCRAQSTTTVKSTHP